MILMYKSQGRVTDRLQGLSFCRAEEMEWFLLAVMLVHSQRPLKKTRALNY